MVTTQPKAPAPYLRHPTADKAREVSVDVGKTVAFVSVIERGFLTYSVRFAAGDGLALCRAANSGDATALGVLADWIEDNSGALFAAYVEFDPAAVAAALRSACEHALYRDDLEAGADRPDRL